MHNEDAVIIRSDMDLNGDHHYRIGQVAKRFDLTMRTIRFYCEIGLIQEVERSGGRRFDVHQVKRLSLIVKARLLGFRLQQIASLIVDGTSGSHDPVLVIPSTDIDELIEEITIKQQQLSAHLSALVHYKPTEISSAA